MHRRIAFAIAFLLALVPAAGAGQASQRKKQKKAPPPAKTAAVWVGTWVLPVNGQNMFVLTLRPQGKAVGGRLTRPARMKMANGLFADIEGTRNDNLVDFQQKKNQILITTQNANDPGDRDNFALTVDGDTMQMTFADIPAGSMQPWLLHRAAEDAVLGSGWQPNRNYAHGPAESSSEEMRQIFAADQQSRMPAGVTVAQPDNPWLQKSDADRRARTHALLDSGELQTGTDFHEAAFIFQHGDTPQDYLLAHTLAMVAVSKGDSGSIWIAAATLDRYLQSDDRPQIFGTQFSAHNPAGPQSPFDRDLIPDSLRLQLGVPSLAQQKIRADGFSQEK